MTTIAQYEAQRSERWLEMLDQFPTEHPHLLTIELDANATPLVTCPGRRHCKLWYAGGDGGKCGFQVEAEEMGSELWEWKVGPKFVPASNPFPVNFVWTGGSEDDPPEIEWWPLKEAVRPEDKP